MVPHSAEVSSSHSAVTAVGQLRLGHNAQPALFPSLVLHDSGAPMSDAELDDGADYFQVQGRLWLERRQA